MNARAPVTPSLSLLGPEDMQRIHEASLAILAQVGVRVDSPAARAVLHRAGAAFADETRCTLDQEVVLTAVGSAGGPFPVFDRRFSPAFTLGDGTTHFGVGVTNLYYEDPLTGNISPFSREQFAASVRLAHVLRQYDVVSTVGVLRDVAPEEADLVATLELAANTTKPLVLLVSDPGQFVPCLELLEALRGDLAEKPFFLPYVNPITPLVFNAETTDKMTAAIERGLPLIFSNYGMAGASTPMSPFRALALLNAELLAGLVFSQAVRPGAPIVLGSLPAYFDMRTMVDFYDPRSLLINAACAEMLTFYGIPHAGTSGSGNGWGPDIIAAGELWFNHLIAGVGLTDLVPFVGGNLGSKVFSPATVLYGAEVIDQVRAFAAGFAPGDLDGLLEEVRAAGPGGSFLESPATLANLRRGYHHSRIFPHYGLEKWEEQGKPRAEARLRAAAAEMMAAARGPDDRAEVLAAGESWLKARRR